MGMGSVFRRGKYYYIRYDLPPGPDGRRRAKSRSCKGLSYGEAKAELTRILADIHGQGGIACRDMSVRDYLDLYLRSSFSIREAPDSLQRAEELIRLYITPELGHLVLQHLNPLQLELACTYLPIDSETRCEVVCLLQRAFDQAVGWWLIKLNPASNLISNHEEISEHHVVQRMTLREPAPADPPVFPCKRSDGAQRSGDHSNAERRSQHALARQVFRRDKGICAICGIDCEAVRRELEAMGVLANDAFQSFVRVNGFHNTRLWNGSRETRVYSYWHVHHVKPIADGGEFLNLDNCQTICLHCHEGKTRQFNCRKITSPADFSQV